MRDDPQGLPTAEHALHAELAQKVLHAWAHNRQQVRVPLVLDLERVDAPQRALLLQAIAAALAAGGPVDEGRAAAAMARVGAAPAELPGSPPDLFRLLAELEEADLGAHAYAAATLVLDRRQAAPRAFLDWLAARFGLPVSLTNGLARRYRG
jgi:uncharacterized membrane protein YebE (DUF533 family)